MEKVQVAMQSGEQAFKERRFDDAEKSYKEAVRLAESLPPGDENLIVALGRLGNLMECDRTTPTEKLLFTVNSQSSKRLLAPGLLE